MTPETDATSSSQPPPASFRFKWDVFLSFRGTDTRHTFTNDLYNALHARGVRVFRDDDGLGRGDEINASLLEAIDDSAASVIVLSEDYASSRWCLEELAKICDCGRLILPVFYRVDPSDVRKQKGPFEESFMSHAVRFEAEPEKVQLWRDAMAKVGGIAGWVCHENRWFFLYIEKNQNLFKFL